MESYGKETVKPISRGASPWELASPSVLAASASFGVNEGKRPLSRDRRERNHRRDSGSVTVLGQGVPAREYVTSRRCHRLH